MTVIDVSKHNGVIDWEKVKPHIDGAIIRCGYGSDGIPKQDDEQWSRNVSECERLGIPFGVYLYSYANNAAKVQSEIAHAKRMIAGHKPTLPVFIDIEKWTCQATWPLLATEWCKAMREVGYIDGIYSWAKVINSLPDCASAYWPCRYGKNDGVPHYEVKPTLEGNRILTGWQYTSKGHVDGITSGGLDMSEWYVPINNSAPAPTPAPTVFTPQGTTLELAIRVLNGEFGNGDARKEKLGTRYNEVQAFLNHVSESSAETLANEVLSGKYGNGEVRKAILGSKYNSVMAIINKPKKSVDEISREVIRGSWGTGEDRKNRLRAAGYDPAVVQNRVNTLMGVSSKPIASARKPESEIVKEVIRGKWGSGQDRKNRLRAAGYNPDRIQKLVNAALK